MRDAHTARPALGAFAFPRRFLVRRCFFLPLSVSWRLRGRPHTSSLKTLQHTVIGKDVNCGVFFKKGKVLTQVFGAVK